MSFSICITMILQFVWNVTIKKKKSNILKSTNCNIKSEEKTFAIRSMMSDEQIPLEVKDNKNKHKVRCNYCNSLILREQQAEFLENEVPMPLMHQKNTKDAHKIETELLKHFWIVNDMFTFENVGFSHTVDKKKYLICADCEMGPVGYHDIDNKQCYIALKRVRHGDADTGITSEINTAIEMKEVAEHENAESCD